MGRRPLPPEQRKPRLSGAQRRKLKYEAEESAPAEASNSRPNARGAKISAPPPVLPALPAPAAPQAPTAPVAEEPPSAGGGEPWEREFLQAGEPDLENPDTDLSFTRKLQSIVLRQMARYTRPSKTQQDVWRRIREMSAVVGYTVNGSKLEADVKALKRKLDAFEDKSTALSREAQSGASKTAPPPDPHVEIGPVKLPESTWRKALPIVGDVLLGAAAAIIAIGAAAGWIALQTRAAAAR
jgi:hypothetical protein